MSARRPTAEPPRSERALAKQLGLSRGFVWRCKQVATIPSDEFEALVEFDFPPTVSELVTIGRGARAPTKRRRRCPHCGGAL